MLLQTLWYKDPITLATLVIAAATAIYCVMTILLWRATKNTADLTRLLFEKTNRPFVATKEVTSIAMGGGLQAQITLSNFGTVPAMDMRVSITHWLNNEQLTSTEQPLSKIILAPRVEIILESTVTDNRLNIVSMSGFEIRLEITYTGITDKPYRHHEIYHHSSPHGLYLISSNGN